MCKEMNVEKSALSVIASRAMPATLKSDFMNAAKVISKAKNAPKEIAKALYAVANNPAFKTTFPKMSAGAVFEKYFTEISSGGTGYKYAQCYGTFGTSENEKMQKLWKLLPIGKLIILLRAESKNATENKKSAVDFVRWHGKTEDTKIRKSYENYEKEVEKANAEIEKAVAEKDFDKVNALTAKRPKAPTGSYFENWQNVTEYNEFCFNTGLALILQMSDAKLKQVFAEYIPPKAKKTDGTDGKENGTDGTDGTDSTPKEKTVEDYKNDAVTALSAYLEKSGMVSAELTLALAILRGGDVE